MATPAPWRGLVSALDSRCQVPVAPSCLGCPPWAVFASSRKVVVAAPETVPISSTLPTGSPALGLR